ncbi:MAG: S8 family serine peptidase [Verrucomicrobia bacterium]|nr:S8 family serine peptidase [Verrucomicrobiota bacterium]HOX03547.1 S8 family serine peptidase [Verrucomicrobiota bacterium]
MKYRRMLDCRAIRGGIGIILWLTLAVGGFGALGGRMPKGGEGVLVKFRPGASALDVQLTALEQDARRTRIYSLVAGLERWEVGRGRSAAVARQLQERGDVEYAEPDLRVQSTAFIPNDPMFGEQWGLHSISDVDVNGPEAWDIATGDPSVVVAVIDTGVEWNHPDLAANIYLNEKEFEGIPGVDDDGNGYVDDIRGWDFVASDNDPMDESGHGTHVAGVVGAVGNNGIGVAGIQWQGRILPLRFIGASGGYVSDAIAAIEYAVAMGARISNNSWGGTTYSSALYDAIRNAGAAGHLFVAAAGNNGQNSDDAPFYPAAYDLDCIASVAAVDSALNRAGFSNYGAESVDLGAPGVGICSLAAGGTYGYMSGTTVAAPYAAGVAALVVSVMPEADAAAVRDRLFSTVRPLPSLQGITTTGGMVDAAAAVASQEDAASGLETGVEYSLNAAAAKPNDPAEEAIQDAAVYEASAPSVSLMWDDNSDNEDGFILERSEGGTEFSAVADLSADTVSHTDTGVSPGCTYTYRVCAYNGYGKSDYSNLVTTTIPQVETVPLAPSDLAAVAQTGYQIILTWALHSDNADYLVLERSTRSSFERAVTIRIPSGSATSYIDAGLVPRVVYYYRLAACNELGVSSYSNTASVRAIR